MANSDDNFDFKKVVQKYNEKDKKLKLNALKFKKSLKILKKSPTFKNYDKSKRLKLKSDSNYYQYIKNDRYIADGITEIGDIHVNDYNSNVISALNNVNLIFDLIPKLIYFHKNTKIKKDIEIIIKEYNPYDIYKFV